MKNWFKFFLAALIFHGFVIFSVHADDASESMEAALAQQTDTQPADSLEETENAVLTAPAAAAPAALPAEVPQAQPSETAVSESIPVEPAPAPIEASAPASSEPVKARDVLPEDQRAESAENALVSGDETVLNEEGDAVSAKNMVLEESAQSGKLMLADFDIGDKPNNLGGDFGPFDKDPSDDTQGCRATFASDDSTGNVEGFALRLDYDVQSPSPAYNGFWMKLESVNALPYDTLAFDVRGASHRFTKRLKVEIKTPDSRSSSYFISGITEQWQTIQIPLKRFKGIKDWSVMSELVLVFDDVNTAPKKGTLLIDQIRFERLHQGMPARAKKTETVVEAAASQPVAKP